LVKTLMPLTLALLPVLLSACAKGFWIGGQIAGDGAVADLSGAETSGGDTAPGDAHTTGDAPAKDGPAADMTIPPAPADIVFYSVGQNTADHKTGTPKVTITGRLATFSQPQIASNLGVGDVVSYGANKERCYLLSKVTTSLWWCTTAKGGTPTQATAAAVNSITHAFGSLAAAVAGASSTDKLGTKDLVAAGLSLGIPCYNDAGGADTSRVIVSGYITGPQNRIRIFAPADTKNRCNTRQRHTGVWDDTRYRLVVTNLKSTEGAITVQVPHTVVDGLQVLAGGTSSVDGIQTTGGPAGVYYVSNNIVVGQLQATSVNSDGICTHGSNSGQLVHVWNNIIYGFNKGSAQASGLYNGSGAKMIAYSNTIAGCQNGLLRSSGTLIAKNNLVQAASQGFIGTFAASSDYNLSSHNDAPGANSKDSTTVLFVDEQNHDYHLRSDDTAARGGGLDLSADPALPFDRDIDGELRVTPWDIGADETP
jgi:hypothetical protein